MGHLWKWTSWGFLVVLWAQGIVAPPMNKQAPANQTVPDHPDNQEKPEDDLETRYNLEYNRYLKEVVDALESDPEFRKKLETAEDEDFRNGKVAAELEYVNHHVRTKLDELKRTELNRLRDLLKMEEERKKADEDPHHNGHVDHSNPHTFEVQDLQMLMNKVRVDLEKADAMRKEEFKEYEMQKEFEKEQKMKSMDEEHKKEYIKELEEDKKKAQQHDPVRPVHHPGSQAQLEEVWEKSDHMTQNFDPKAFFYLHDLDGNGYWDEQEVNALFLKELDKIYAYAGNNHVDNRERQEEMERMREHVFKETDTNHDRFISFEEFLEQTKRDEWRRDEGWESIDQKPQFTQKEYEEFERRRQAEIQRMIQAGQLPAHPAGLQPPYQYVHPNQMPLYDAQYPNYGDPNYLPPGAHPNMQYQPVHPAGVPMNQAQYAVPQYQAHPGAGQPQYQAHPAAGQPQYQAHPAAGQPQYQAHPAAGQPQYQAHPAAGQPQYQAHPAAGQPQYQAHPAAGQPQYQAQPAPGQPQFQPQPPAGQPQYQAPPAPAQPANPAPVQQQPSGGKQQYQQPPQAGQQQQYQQPPQAGQQQQYQQPPQAGQQQQQQQYQQPPQAGQQQQYQQPAQAGQQQQYQQPPQAGQQQYHAQPAQAQPSANQPPPPNPANSQPIPVQQQHEQQIPNQPNTKSNEIPGKP